MGNGLRSMNGSRWRSIVATSVGLGVLAGAAIAQSDLSFAARARVLEHWLTEQVEYHAVPGVVIGVVDGEQLVWSTARGQGITTDSRFRMGSVSKIFTATAIVALRDEGKLKLDDPVAHHLPWFALRLKGLLDGEALSADGVRYLKAELDGSRITIRHLLTHTGGLPREAGVPYWTDHVFPDSARLERVVRNQSALWPPGFDYQYSNLGLGLLGEIVAAASGTSYGEYLARTILRPMGMERSTALPTKSELEQLTPGHMRRMPDRSRSAFDYYDTGALAGAANVISTLDDMARFAALHLQAATLGRAPTTRAPTTDAVQIMSAESLDEMHSVHWASDSLSTLRGLGFSLSEHNGERVASHGGWIAGHRSHLILIPNQQLAVIAMVNADDVSPSFFAREALDVLGPAVLAQRSNKERDSAVARSRSRDFGPLEGTYSDPWASYYEVMGLDDELYFYEHSYPPADHALASLTRLEPDSAGGFVFGKARDQVRFEFAVDGADASRVVRILRRSDYLFPVLQDGTIAINMP